MLIIITVLIVLLLLIAVIDRHCERRRNRNLISLVVPFRTDHGTRERNWNWLRQYYVSQLPEAELIECTNDETPFCKTAAFNEGVSRARGDVLVLMDADCLIDPSVIRESARRIREARKEGRHLWHLPYRRFYRLTKAATSVLLLCNPGDIVHPLYVNDPGMVEKPDSASSGHWWGALIQIVPREAWEAVGGMDERFKGWGGEDVSFMHAVDTVYGKHRTLDNPVYHLWHSTIPGRWKASRQWSGQARPDMNDNLAISYSAARGDKERMLRLINGS